MWRRFTERSRKVVFYAQEEAQRYGRNVIAPEHLLLGMTREPGSVAEHLLSKQGVAFSQVRTEAERVLLKGDDLPTKDAALSPSAKLVVDRALEESKSLTNNYIGTEHLLIGLIRDADGLAGKILAHLRIDLVKAREHTKELQANSSQPPLDF